MAPVVMVDLSSVISMGDAFVATLPSDNEKTAARTFNCTSDVSEGIRDGHGSLLPLTVHKGGRDDKMVGARELERDLEGDGLARGAVTSD